MALAFEQVAILGFDPTPIGSHRALFPAASEVGLLLKGATGQTADLFQLQDSLGNLLTKTDKTGALTLPFQVPALLMGGLDLDGNPNQVLAGYELGHPWSGLHIVPVNGVFSRVLIGYNSYPPGVDLWVANGNLRIGGVGPDVSYRASITVPAGIGGLRVNADPSGGIVAALERGSGTGGRVSVDDLTNHFFVVSAAPLTTDRHVVNINGAWNNASVLFTGVTIKITDTLSAVGSKIIDMLVGSTSMFSLTKEGTVKFANPLILATGAAHTVDDVIAALQTLGLVRQS